MVFLKIVAIIFFVIFVVCLIICIKNVVTKRRKVSAFSVLTLILSPLISIIITIYSPGSSTVGNQSPSKETVVPASTAPTPAPWSDLMIELPDYVTDENYEIEEIAGYIYRDREITTSQSPSLSGWDQYDSSVSWGDYGEWSNWSNTYIAASDYREVATRQVDATYKTQYYYSRWSQRSDGSGWNGPSKGTWNGIYCGYFNERDWSDSPLNYAWSEGEIKVYGIGGDYWYNEETRQVEISPAYTQYRYRERSKTITYYYERWGDWKPCLDDSCSSTDNRQVIPHTLYQYRPK